jgi:F-type H+-transporting ATPase subunit epsilon
MFDGVADAVVAPAFDGEVGVLPNHAPFMTLLGNGRLTVRRGDVVSRFFVRGGFLQVVDNRVRVVAEHVQGELHAS